MSENHIAARIAEWAVALRYEDLPRRVIEEAKNQVLSVIAAVHAGHFSEPGRTVAKVVREWSAGKEATLIPSGERTSVQHALFGNAALSMALDLDDYLFAGHTGHSAVLTTLALAEKLGVNGREFLTTQVLANEIEGRIGAAVLLGPANGQLWGFLHQIGSALIGARLLKLDATETANAIAIAWLQPAFPMEPAFFGSEGKTVLAAQTAVTGVQAAELAAAGLRGAADVFSGNHGFLQSFTPQPLLEAFSGFGKVWLTETLSYKMYPGCAYLDTCIDCVLALVQQQHIDPAAVKDVHVEASPMTVGMEALAAPYLAGPESLPTTLNFSVAYSVAAALADRELTARQFARKRIADRKLWDLAGRVRVTLDDEYSRRMRDNTLLQAVTRNGEDTYELAFGPADLAAFRASFGARVRIEMLDGRILEKEEEIPVGGAGRPFDERRRAVEDKFRRETRYTLRKEKMEKVIDLVLHLETCNPVQVRDIVRSSCSEKT